MPWRDRIDVHPAADLLPMMSQAELKALAEDIKKNGMKVPIVIQRGQTGDKAVLLDGRSRLEAIDRFTDIPIKVELGMIVEHRRCLRVVLKGGDPNAIVASLNFHRRHLTAEQKRELIGKLLKAQPESSDLAISKVTKVSDKTVGAVRRELEGRSEIPSVETRTDTKGRRQRVHKSKPVSVKTSGTAAEQSAEACQQPNRSADHHAEPAQTAEQSAETRKALDAATDDQVGQDKNMFLMNCAATKQIVRQGYRGPIDKQVRTAARRVADAWLKLADELEAAAELAPEAAA